MKIRTEAKFAAAHKLPNYKGLCSRLHGHSWKVEVELEGVVSADTDMLVDFKEVKKIITAYDHEYLNQPEQRHLEPIENPTAERLAEIFVRKLKKLEVSSIIVRVWESDTSYAEHSWRSE